MRGLRLAAAALLAVAIPLLGAAPAHAALGGTCTASGTLKSTGITYDAKSTNKVTIPLKDDVDWKGAVSGASPPRAIAGNVSAKLPWPLPKVDIGTWGSQSTAIENSGTYHYDFPSVFAGYDIPLSGAHKEKGVVVCTGAVTVHFKGGGFGNPALIGTFVLMLLSGVGLIISFKPKAA